MSSEILKSGMIASISDELENLHTDKYMKEYLTGLLVYVLGRDKAIKAAEEICHRYGNIDRMLCIPVEELSVLPSMNKSAAVFIKLLGAISSRRITEGLELGRFYEAEEIYEYVKALFIGLDRETVYLLCFDEDGRIISSEYMGEGTVNASDVYPRRLVAAAIKSGAKAVILAHNHPFSNADPSRDDVISTDRLKRVFANSGIRLIKHIVVSGRSYSVIDA